MQSWTSSIIPSPPRKKKKMIEQGLNCTDPTIKEMTDFFETRVENSEPKGEKRKSSATAKKSKDKKSNKKRKRADSDSSVVDSSEELSVERQPNRKYFILNCKCSHSMDNCKDLLAMINKHKEKKKKIYKSYRKKQQGIDCSN